MQQGSLRVTFSNNSGCRLLLPGAKSRQVEISLGQAKLAASLAPATSSNEARLEIHKATARRLGLRPGMDLAYCHTASKIKLGPVIGILTAGVSKVAGRVPGNREMFTYVLGAGRKNGALTYVFTPEGISWERGIVRGFERRGRTWVAGTFPLPDVVYNRIPNRKLELSPIVSRTKRQLRARNISYFNPRYLNKLDLYRILSKEEAASPYLPWTRKLASQHDLHIYLQKFGSVYLKPKNAFAGKGILRVTRASGGYLIRHRANSQNRELSYANMGSLWAALRRLMGGKAYMVQQAISLARYQGRNFDVRLLAQKNGSGQWQVSGQGVRVAGKGCITTHVPNGGFIAPIEKVLPAVFSNHQQVLEHVKKLALTIAPLVEKGCRGNFGEMSMDIGIDKQGRPWFFEANAKPMKFDEDRIRAKGLHALISYMRFLAGFPTIEEVHER